MSWVSVSYALVSGAALAAASPLLAAQAQPAPAQPAPAAPAPTTPPVTATQPTEMGTMDMGNMDMEPTAGSAPGAPTNPAPAAAGPPMDMGAMPGSPAAPMDMGSMQGGRAPAGARDPNAYADGYKNSTLPGFEKTDQLPVSFMLVDQLEFAAGNEGQGIAWSAQFARGPDKDKFWFRTQGLKQSRDRLDPETGIEALWWHGYSPFWGRVLGIRQDIGRGAHTWLAFGIEGLMPYWFKLELTGYVSDSANLAVRAKASYDLLFTNRLIMTPSVETNIYSKRQVGRQLGSGVSNLELGLRLRYEIKRKLAPYVGFVWERSFGGTARFKRIESGPVTERRLLAGIRLWW